MKRLKINKPDAIALIGGVCLTEGLWLVYPPAAFIVVGLLLLAAGFLLGRGKQ